MEEFSLVLAINTNQAAKQILLKSCTLYLTVEIEKQVLYIFH